MIDATEPIVSDPLQLFCGEHARYDMTKPFRCLNYWCATDGKILVWRDAETGEHHKEGRRLPSAGSMIALANECAHEFQPLESTPTDTTCYDCDGTRMVYQKTKCTTCGGTGEHQCDCELCEADCPNCDGGGEIEQKSQPKIACDTCGGTGIFSCFVLGHKFNTGYIAKIVAFANGESIRCRIANKMLHFVVGKYSGLLMGVEDVK